MGRMDELREAAARVGIGIDTYAPGDGMMRYRFTKKPGVDYFAGYGLYTALGIKEAETWLSGYVQGWFARHWIDHQNSEEEG